MTLFLRSTWEGTRKVCQALCAVPPALHLLGRIRCEARVGCAGYFSKICQGMEMSTVTHQKNGRSKGIRQEKNTQNKPQTEEPIGRVEGAHRSPIDKAHYGGGLLLA